MGNLLTQELVVLGTDKFLLLQAQGGLQFESHLKSPDAIFTATPTAYLLKSVTGRSVETRVQLDFQRNKSRVDLDDKKVYVSVGECACGTHIEILVQVPLSVDAHVFIGQSLIRGVTDQLIQISKQLLSGVRFGSEMMSGHPYPGGGYPGLASSIAEAQRRRRSLGSFYNRPFVIDETTGGNVPTPLQTKDGATVAVSPSWEHFPVSPKDTMSGIFSDPVLDPALRLLMMGETEVHNHPEPPMLPVRDAYSVGNAGHMLNKSVFRRPYKFIDELHGFLPQSTIRYFQRLNAEIALKTAIREAWSQRKGAFFAQSSDGSYVEHYPSQESSGLVQPPEEKKD